jgi:HTH-type transcriptional regulator/antitoxin HipB
VSISRDEHLVTTARELGEVVKHFRTRAGLTQVDAAEALGVGQPYLSSLEAGKFGRSLTHVLRLLGLVGCEIVIRPRAQSTATSTAQLTLAAGHPA